jgi:hypothetical protein
MTTKLQEMEQVIKSIRRLKAPVPLQVARYHAVLVKLAVWESKAKRAKTKLQKYQRIARRYERKIKP